MREASECRTATIQTPTLFLCHKTTRVCVGGVIRPQQGIITPLVVMLVLVIHMGAFFDLIVNGISCIGYGILIALAIVALLCVILSSFKKDLFRSNHFIISLAILFVILTINMSVMVGAIKIKGIANRSVDAIEQVTHIIRTADTNDVTELLKNGDYIGAAQTIGKASEGVDLDNLQELKNQLGDNWDLLKQYFDSSNMSITMLFISPLSTIKKFNGKMNKIIVEEILWSVLFIVITIVIGMRFPNSKTGSYHNQKSRYTSTYIGRDDDF